MSQLKFDLSCGVVVTVVSDVVEVRYLFLSFKSLHVLSSIDLVISERRIDCLSRPLLLLTVAGMILLGPRL